MKNESAPKFESDTNLRPVSFYLSYEQVLLRGFLVLFLYFLFNSEGLYNWSLQFEANSVSLATQKLLLSYSQSLESLGFNNFRHLAKRHFERFQEISVYSNKNSEKLTQRTKKEFILDPDFKNKSAFKNINTEKTLNTYADREPTAISGKEANTIPETPPSNSKEANSSTNSVTSITSSKLQSSSQAKYVNSNDQVLMLGDSILKMVLEGQFKRYLQKIGTNLDIQSDARIGTGLTRPDVFSWQNRAENLLEGFTNLKAVVVFLGTNDSQNLKDGSHAYVFGRASWDRIYSERVINLTQAACKKTQKVYWIGQLPMRDAVFNEKMQHVNNVIRQSLKQTSCGQYVSIDEWLTINGQYVDYLNLNHNKRKRIRSSDGIHLTPEGSAWLAKHFSQKYLVVSKSTEEDGLE